MKISVILLAGGQGTRFGSEQPKQFFELCAKPVALYSYELFCQRSDIDEIVIVCAPSYRKLFNSERKNLTIKFALPGERRQDSVFNGLQAVNPNSEYVCVHDSARPLISDPIMDRLIAAAREHGAAVAGIPIKFTVKESSSDSLVSRTPDRRLFWEIQTPQMMRKHVFIKGFEYVNAHQITVTDDVSIVELIGHPVKIVTGDDSNIKITTPNDFYLVERLLRQKNG